MTTAPPRRTPPDDRETTVPTAASTGTIASLTAPVVSAITRLSAAETVRARIALAIQLGLLAPGEQIPPDREVAEALAVGEITVRRALESLAEDGVLERRRGRSGGTFVTDATRSDRVDSVGTYRADAVEVRRLIDERTLLECALTHFAAVGATEERLDELDAHVAAAAAAANWTEYHAADERFHLAVAEAAALPWALTPYRDVLFALYRYFLPYPIEYLHGANHDHAALVDALRAHDTTAAVEVSRRHVQELHRTMFVALPTVAPRGEER